MLNRERIALRVLEEAGGQLSKTVFVKLMFLIRMETELNQHASFYDFVPFRYGPFSFALYRDLDRLESYGYVSKGDDHLALSPNLLDDTQHETTKLARHLQCAVIEIMQRYGGMKLSPLIRDVYRKYRWYAINSERTERKYFAMLPRPKASPAVYTIGYEGRTVDSFFNYLLEKGIKAVIDVRANPVSRKYGFAGSRMRQIGENLGLTYQHLPSLGISSGERATLSDMAPRTQLFAHYKQTTLVDREQEVKELGKYMQSNPSVLVCVEKDVECCHRSRLSLAIANETGMEVVNL